MKKYIVALLAMACLSAAGYAKDVEAEIIQKLNRNERVAFAMSNEVNAIADHIVDLANKQARAKKNYVAYWNATLVNFMAIEYSDNPFVYITDRTLANVKLWSDHAIKVAAGKAEPELYVMRFLTLWHYYSLSERTFIPAQEPRMYSAENKRTLFDVWAPNHKKEIREMLNEFEKAEKINPTVAYSTCGYNAVDLYAAIGKKSKADELNRTLQRMETARMETVRKAVKKQNQSLARKKQSVKRQVKTNMASPKNTAPTPWYEYFYYKGGGHF